MFIPEPNSETVLSQPAAAQGTVTELRLVRGIYATLTPSENAVARRRCGVLSFDSRIARWKDKDLMKIDGDRTDSSLYRRSYLASGGSRESMLWVIGQTR